jgi:hypothetical protein
MMTIQERLDRSDLCIEAMHFIARGKIFLFSAGGSSCAGIIDPGTFFFALHAAAAIDGAGGKEAHGREKELLELKNQMRMKADGTRPIT